VSSHGAQERMEKERRIASLRCHGDAGQRPEPRQREER
jgi:hypothetical protein